MDANWYREIFTKNFRFKSKIGAKKITISPKRFLRTYGHTDMSNYRVASLLKKNMALTDMAVVKLKLT